MFKKSFTFAVLLTAAFALVAIAASDDDKVKQTTCPIRGEDIDKEVFVDYKDQRIFFCCAGCVEPFNKDPEGQLKKMAEAGITPMKLEAQSVCPVSGEALANKDLHVDADGKRIYICCEACRIPVKNEPAAHIKKIADRGEYLEDIEN